MILRDEFVKGKSTSEQGCAVCARLTPEESARKFDILEGIDAIPTSDLRGCLKPHVRRLMSHCEYGQRSSYASYNTIAGETGVSPRQARDQRADIIDGGWFVEASRRGKNEHARADLVPGPRLIEFLRSYFASVDARKQQRGKPLRVDVHTVNPAGSNGHPGVDVPPVNRVDVPPVNRVDGTGVNNPVSVSRTDKPASSSPRGAGRKGGGGGERSVAERDARRGGKDKDKDTPSTQSRWRDLSVIHPDQRLDEENNILCHANMVSGDVECLASLEDDLNARWPAVMEAASGRYELIDDVISDMHAAAEAGKPIHSPLGYLLSVLKDRARPRQVVTMSGRDRPQEARPATAPPDKTPLLSEERVREGIREFAARLRGTGANGRQIRQSLEGEMAREAEAARLCADEIGLRLGWLESEWGAIGPEIEAEAARREQLNRETLASFGAQFGKGEISQPRHPLARRAGVFA